MRLLIPCIVSLALLVSATGIKAQQKITIVYTNSLNGNIDYCHCKEEPNGGLVKRATVIDEIRAQSGTVFLFDTGDNFTFEKDEILAKYIVKAYGRIGYDAIQFGDQEFSAGIDTFLTYKQFLPLINNNLQVKSGGGFKSISKRYRIIIKNGFKLGVIGTISPETFKFYPQTLLSNLKTAKQIAEIQKDIREIKKHKADAIVLLSHSGLDSNRVLIKKLKDVNVIVGGHSQNLLEKTENYGGRLIVQAGTNGAHIGILDLTIKGGKIVDFKNSFKRPDDTQPADDPAVRKIIDDYKAEVKEKFKGLKFN